MKKLILFSILLLIPHQAFAGLSTEDSVKFKQIATPATPSTNYNKLYFKSDDKLYKLDDAGNEVEVGASGSSGHTIQDEGTPLTARTNLNFVGGEVTVTDGGAGPDSTIVTIPTVTTISGNAGTATALAANGTNCGSGEYPLGVDASGAVESCTDATTEIAAYAQPLDADLTTYAGITPSANIQTLLGSADYAAARTNLGLAIGTNVQAYDGDLDDLADGSLTGTKVGFADTDSNFAATNIQAAVEELDNVNVSGVNAADGKVDWTQLVSVPAGFADGTDDGGGGAGDVETVGDCASGACFDGTQGTTLTLYNAGGNMTAAYDGTDLKFSKPLQLANDEYITNSTDDAITMTGSGGGTVDLSLSFYLSDTSFEHPVIQSSTNTVVINDNVLMQSGSAYNFYDAGNDRSGSMQMQALADLRFTTSEGGIEFFPNAGTIDMGSASENITLTPGTNTMVVSSGTGVTLLDMGSLDVDVPTEVYDATGWNGDNTVPTKDAVRDKLEEIFPSGGVLNENASVGLDPAGSADGKYSGITVTGTGGATIAFGDLVTLDKDDSRWELVDISVAAAATGDARGLLGMAVTSSSDGGALTVLLHGIIRADANFPALTIGAPIYASTTGDIVVTQPTTTDHVIRVIGAALTADEMFFDPDQGYATHT